MLAFRPSSRAGLLGLSIYLASLLQFVHLDTWKNTYVLDFLDSPKACPFRFGAHPSPLFAHCVDLSML